MAATQKRHAPVVVGKCLRRHEGRAGNRATKRPVFANLGTRRVVDRPAVVSTSAEFCSRVNSGTPLGVDRAARRSLPIAAVVPASKRPALSLS